MFAHQHTRLTIDRTELVGWTSKVGGWICCLDMSGTPCLESRLRFLRDARDRPAPDRGGRSRFTYSPFREIAVRLGESAENVLAGQPGSFCVSAGCLREPRKRAFARLRESLSTFVDRLGCQPVIGRKWRATLLLRPVLVRVPGLPVRAFAAAAPVAGGPWPDHPVGRVRRWRVPRPGDTPSRREPHPASRSSAPEVAPRPVAQRRLLFCYLAHYNIVARYAAVWKLPTRVLGDMTGSGAWREDRMTKKCGAVVPSGMSGPGLPCSIQAGGTNYLE